MGKNLMRPVGMVGWAPGCPGKEFLKLMDRVGLIKGDKKSFAKFFLYQHDSKQKMTTI